MRYYALGLFRGAPKYLRASFRVAFCLGGGAEATFAELANLMSLNV